MENILETEIEKEFEENFLRYSLSVITDRAIPDVKDGNKPVHRRILHIMKDMGLTYDKRHKKCASVTGNVIARVHPRGDTSVYEAMAKMAQPFYLRYPLIDWQGSVGNVSGDGPAAARYTECRLSKIGELMMEGIKKDAVDTKLNYADDEYEPIVVPSLFPNLICNGTSGIGVAIATNLVPHNLNEVMAGAIALLNNGDITTAELMEYIKGPDFPLGGVVINPSVLLDTYETGRSPRGKSIKLRADYNVKEEGREKLLTFTSIPHGTTTIKIMEDIEKLIEAQSLPTLNAVLDNSNEENGINISLGFTKQTDVTDVLNLLFSKTDLEVSISVNNTCLVDGQPVTLGIRDMLAHYINHQVDVLKRTTNYDLDKLNARLEVLFGHKVAVENIDVVVEIIKSADNKSDAKAKLMSTLSLTENQAEAILDMKLSKLTSIEVKDILDNLKQVEASIEECNQILADIKGHLIKRFTQISKDFGDDRRTKLEETEFVKVAGKKSKSAGVQMYVLKQDNGTINTYKTSVAGSIGVMSDDYLYAFSSMGMAYKISVSKIVNGMNINVLANVKSGETIVDIGTAQSEVESFTILTELGMIKRLKKSEMDSSRSTGYIKLQDGDKVLSVETRKGFNYVSITTSDDYNLAFEITGVAETGKAGKGVKSVSLHKDCIVSKVEFFKTDKNLTLGKRAGVGKKPKK